MKQAEKTLLSVLVVAKYDPTIDWVQFSLQEQNYQLVGQVASVSQALEKINETHVDIILADTSGDGVLEIEWIQKLVVTSTGILVLVTATNSEMDFVREAMLAGAHGFLLKPFDLPELSRSIEQVHKLWLQRHALLAEAMSETATAPAIKGHTIAVFSPKGGTGVTTLAINLAVALKQQTDTPVLLVDADLRTADVDIFLNIFSKRSILDLIGLGQKIDEELLERVATEHASGVTVLRGDPRLQFVDAPAEPGQMSSLIDNLISIWPGYIVINTCNSLDRWTVEILDAVDTVLLVTKPELPALRVMRNFLDLAEVEADPSGKWQLVMTSYQNQKVLRMTDIETSIHYPINAIVAEDAALVTASINRGTPLVSSHSKSNIAKDILALAKQLIEANPRSQKSQSPNGKRLVSEEEMVSQSKQAIPSSFRKFLISSLRLSNNKLEQSVS